MPPIDRFRAGLQGTKRRSPAPPAGAGFDPLGAVRSVGEFFGTVFDTALGTFRKFADLELGLIDLELAKRRRKEEAQNRRSDFPGVEAAPGSDGTISRLISPRLVLFAGAAVALFIALRR